MHIMTAPLIVTIITNVMRIPLKNTDMCLLLLSEEFPSCAGDVGSSGDDFEPLKKWKNMNKKVVNCGHHFTTFT